MSVLRRMLPLCAAAALVVPGALGVARADDAHLSRDEARLLQLINDERGSRGLVRVQAAAGTTDVARAWTENHLSTTKSLDHNPDLGEQLDEHGSAGWTEAGENVGKAPIGDMDGLFRAYMNSPSHREIIIEPAFRYVGIGVFDTQSDGQAWNTLDFVDIYGRKASPAPAPARSPAPQQSPAPAQSTRRPAPPAPAAPPAAPAPPGSVTTPAVRPTTGAASPTPPTQTTAPPSRPSAAPGAAVTLGHAPPDGRAVTALRVPAVHVPVDTAAAVGRAAALLFICVTGFLTSYEWSRTRAFA
ncbi:MAG: CAP domain-containing protein [Mycobacteriales bacterium]|nr:CAP domain-containing protein [Frankia sp.]